METTTLAFGVVRSFDNPYAVAGVTVAAHLPAGISDLPGAALSKLPKLALATTDVTGHSLLYWKSPPSQEQIQSVFAADDMVIVGEPLKRQ